MRLFYSYLIFFVISLPVSYWYLSRKYHGAFLLTIPGKFSMLNIGYLICAMILYMLVPTYREHIEPSITIISMMIADGYQAYTTFDDPNVYSILYGPVTYLFQSKFLQLFSNPILGSKIYGVLCFVSGVVILASVLKYKYGLRNMLTGMFYFSCIVLLFAQVSFRNQSDSVIILGNSLAVTSVFLPAGWLSKLLLAFGGALSINAKFHAIGYITPLLWFFFRQHGTKNLVVTGLLCLAFAFSPFLLESYSFANFLVTMQAYSKLPVHPEIFLHNITTAYVIYLPLLLVSLYLLKKRQPAVAFYSYETFWTFLATNIVLVMVCLTAAIDGAGSYHLVHFAPAFAALLTIYYSEHKNTILSYISLQRRAFKALLFTCLIAWYLSVGVFIASVQKKYIWFIQENYHSEIPAELSVINNEIQKNNWRVFFGYSGEASYTSTYYRPLLWNTIRDNSLDPIALMGRKAVGVDIPDTFAQRLSNQYYDVIIIPKPGKPFSMYNWHNVSQPIFGDDIQRLFENNYTPFKEYDHFVLWKARRAG